MFLTEKTSSFMPPLILAMVKLVYFFFFFWVVRKLDKLNVTLRFCMLCLYGLSLCLLFLTEFFQKLVMVLLHPKANLEVPCIELKGDHIRCRREK